MSNYWKKFTEKTSFGTTELCKYCGSMYVIPIKSAVLPFVKHEKKCKNAITTEPKIAFS